MRRNLNCAAVWNAGIKYEATKTIMPNVEMNVSLGEGVRRLPVYLLLDCSGSMAGAPIEAVRRRTTGGAAQSCSANYGKNHR